MLFGVVTYATEVSQFSGEREAIALKRSEIIAPGQCYISGDFMEETPIHVPYIRMIITNLDSNQTYDLTFNLSHQYSYYQLPSGKYKISSFITRYLHRMRSIKNTDDAFPIQFGFMFDTMVLGVHQELLREFELKPGEILYLGDYLARTIHIDSTQGWTRTAKISLYNNFEKFSQDYSANKKNSALNLRSLDIEECISEPINDPLFVNQKAVIAGRFVSTGRASGYSAHFYNMSTKKMYEIPFKSQSDIRYVEITPGEYFVQSMGSLLGYELIPKELLLPFVIKPNELLYVGCVNIDEEERRFPRVTTMGSTVINDFEVSQQELKDSYEGYTIVNLMADQQTDSKAEL
jgi:hypothetical protein